MEGNFLATDLVKFADQIVWYMHGDQALQDQDFFLAHIMAFTPQVGYEHCRKHFHFTDEDFVQALRNAPPGDFQPEDWLYWNNKFGLEPPLPLPVVYKAPDAPPLIVNGVIIELKEVGANVFPKIDRPYILPGEK